MNIVDAVNALLPQMSEKAVGIFRIGQPLGVAVYQLFRSPELLKQYGGLAEVPAEALMQLFTVCTREGIPVKKDGSPAIAMPTQLIAIENLIATDWEVAEFVEPSRIIVPEIKINIDPKRLRVIDGGLS